MIWDNFSIFRTNCAIAWGMLRGFLQIERGERASEIPEMFDDSGPQLKTFMSVRILPYYLRRKLLRFE